MAGTNGASEKTAVADALKNAAEWGREARKRAEDARKEAVKSLNAIAETLRKEAREKGAGRDVLGNIDDIAKGLERMANSLKRGSLEEAARPPKPAPRRGLTTLAIIFVIGVIIGLVLAGDRDREE